jgi:hypothetical protein
MQELVVPISIPLIEGCCYNVTRNLLNQGFLLDKLKSLLRKLCGRHHDLVDRYGISVLQMTGVTSGPGTAYPSGAPEFTPGFLWGSYLLDL